MCILPVYMCMSACEHGGQKSSDPLELERQETVSCLLWETNSNPLQERLVLQTTELSFQPLEWLPIK